MKKVRLFVIGLVCCSLLCTSCIGSFGLSKKLHTWNNSIGDKWINELVFFAFWILPVYEVAVFADVVILNTIEFWSGSNPVTADMEYNVKGENGSYLVQTTENGYIITNEENETMVELAFEAEDQSQSVIADGNETKLFSFINDNEVKMYLPHGESMNVELSQAGVLAFKEAVNANLTAQK